MKVQSDSHRKVSQIVRSHNPKVGGSNPPPRNHERHCRNAVAFACLKKRHFPESVLRFPQLPFRIASGSPDNLGTSPFVDASAFRSTDSHTRAELLPDRMAFQLGARLRTIAEAALAL